MNPPDLLPFDGDWTAYVERVYARYHADIIASDRTLWGRPIRVRFNPTTYDKPFNFWHVVSEGEVEDDRTPDLKRCARIGWIAWLLDCCDQDVAGVRWYLSERSTSRGRRTNLVIWSEAHDYVVIVEPRDGFALLVSAYPVTERRAAKLRRECDAYWAAPKTIPHWGQP